MSISWAYLCYVLQLYCYVANAASAELKLGVILPSDVNYPWSYKRVVPGIEIAVETVSNQNFMPGYQIWINVSDSECSETNGPLAAFDMVMHNGAHVFFGPVCDYALAPVARFTPHWNRPLLSAGGMVSNFDNKKEFQLLTRVNGAYSNVAGAFLSVVQDFGWTRISLVYHDNIGERSDEKSTCYFQMEALFKEMSKMFPDKPWYFAFDANRPENYTDILKNASRHARILALCGPENSTREMMIAAHDLGLHNGQYAFINMDLWGSNTKPWFRANDTDERNNKARLAYQALITLTIRKPSSPQYTAFDREVKKRTKEKYSDVVFEEGTDSYYAGLYHDAVILYAIALNESLENGFSIDDGAEITKRMWNRTFEGIFGPVSINENGDKMNDYSLLDMDPETGDFRVVGNYFGNRNLYEPVNGRQIHWAGTSGTPPLDTPRCGFELIVCPPMPPEPPHDVTITSCEPFAAELHWEPSYNGGSEISGYLVQFNTSESPSIWNNATEIKGNVVTAEIKLYPWAVYRFRILAKNEIGYSEPSIPTKLRCILPPDRPLQHPAGVRTLTHEREKLIIEWTPLPRLLQGGPGLSYIVSWRSSGDARDIDWNRKYFSDPRVSRFETGVLGYYHPFEIRVEAENVFGLSPQEPLVHIGYPGEDNPVVVPQDFHLDPTKPVGHNRAHFAWMDADKSPELVRGQFQGYKLQCESANGTIVETIISNEMLKSEQGVVQAMVTGLPPNTIFEAKVAVVNTHYTGQYSNIVVFRTAENPDREPVEQGMNKTYLVEITNVTAASESIHLTWKIPFRLQQSKTSKYRIDCRQLVRGKTSRKSWVPCKNFTSKNRFHAREATVKDLQSNSMYKVRVRMKTEAGGKIISAWKRVNTTGSPAERQSSTADIRLPETIRPLHYKLTFDPKIYKNDVNSFISEGITEITLTCIRRSNRILLHSKDLNWTTVELSNSNHRKINIHSINTMSNVEMVEIVTEKPLKENKTYHLKIKFSGKITDILQGFYYSPYRVNYTTRYIFTTMMQPTDARRVFPCFDEPDFKATFQINIIRRDSMISTSNAVLEKTERRDNESVIDRYAVTPKMSTYLVAFVIGDIHYLETYAGATRLRTWARKDAVQHTKFALEIGAKLFTFFENYFQIKYPMDKIDMVAVPTLVFNAMEHWGMVTYRESAILWEEGVSSQADKEWVALVIAHELSHQWFGNLVSPRWWDDLWLNEGFATYMMFLGVDAVLPEWKMINKLPVDYRGSQNVMSIDDAMTSHPVYVPVSHPNEINEIFDLVSYAKGCAVIRMMNFYLGNETFIKGLNRYLNEFSYETATHNDLWRVLGKQSADNGNRITDVKSIMDTWLLEMNYPVVMISRESDTSFKISQTPFLLNETERQNRSNVYWEIPFVYTHGKERNFNKTSTGIVWLHKDGSKVHIVDASLSNDTWIIGNTQQVGFYRVNYEEENWRLLISQLNSDHKVIHPISRAQIINDAWNLARAGMLSLHIALSTLEYLDLEEDFVPWKAAFSEIEYLDRSLQLTPSYGQFKALMRKKLALVYYKSENKKSHYEKMHETAVYTHACKYGIKECTKTALDDFDRWASDASYRVNPDLKTSVYCTSVKARGEWAWTIVFQSFIEAQSPSERGSLLHSLSCVNDPWIITGFLNWSLSSDLFWNTEKVDVIDYLGVNPIGRLLSWDFVVGNWNTYFERYGAGLNLFAKLVNGLTKSYNTEAELLKVESFVEKTENLGTATREFRKSIGKIRFNVDWMSKHYDDIQRWLNIQMGEQYLD